MGLHCWRREELGMLHLFCAILRSCLCLDVSEKISLCILAHPEQGRGEGSINYNLWPPSFLLFIFFPYEINGISLSFNMTVPYEFSVSPSSFKLST